MKQFVFIDESGNSDFYGKRNRPLWESANFVPYLLIGLVVIQDRKIIRRTVDSFISNIKGDDLYNEISTVSHEDWMPHASKDHPEVRVKFIELLRTIRGVEFYAAIARKNPERFRSKHNNNAKEFYFDALHKLLAETSLEAYNDCQLYLARIQSNTISEFRDAVKKSFELSSDDEYKDFKCDVVKAKEYPEMCVVDYYLWALQRYISKGERRFLTSLEKNCKVIYDIYDTYADDPKYFYPNNRFYLEKASNYDDLRI